MVWGLVGRDLSSFFSKSHADFVDGSRGLCCCLSFMFAAVARIEFVFALASLHGFCSERLVITGLNNPW